MATTIGKAKIRCDACDKTLKSHKYLERHRKSKRHKMFVVNNFPEALMYKYFHGIKMDTGRIDLDKEHMYIKVIPIIEKNKCKKNKKRKKKNTVDSDEEEFVKQKTPTKKKSKSKINIKLDPSLFKDYNYLNVDDMSDLIDVFVHFLKVKKINPDSLFDYTEYTNNADDEVDCIERTYIDVYELVSDDTLFT